MAVAAILAALFARERTGQGQRIDLSMTDGIRYLMADISAATLLAGHPEESWRGTLNCAMPTYDTYRTADGGWIAVGALEPKFIAVLADGLNWPELTGLMRRKDRWPEARLGLERRFSERELSHWVGAARRIRTRLS
jgi:alpha-methylacyl-CoA racemase